MEILYGFFILAAPPGDLFYAPSFYFRRKLKISLTQTVNKVIDQRLDDHL